MSCESWNRRKKDHNDQQQSKHVTHEKSTHENSEIEWLNECFYI